MIAMGELWCTLPIKIIEFKSKYRLQQLLEVYIGDDVVQLRLNVNLSIRHSICPFSLIQLAVFVGIYVLPVIHQG
jgi:hypothetical protein